MTIVNLLAVMGGMVAIGAATHVNIVSTVGYGDPYVAIIILAACAAGFGSLFSTLAWSEQRYVLACFLALVAVSAETWSVKQTAERVIASREARKTPARQSEASRAVAVDLVARAEAALTAIQSTPRLEQALAAKASADRAVDEKAALRGCAANCRALLEKQVATASADLEVARNEIADRRAKAERDVQEAKTRLAAIPPPAPRAVELADLLNVPGWIMELSDAALGALIANGLGCGLLVFGAHHAPHQREPLVAVREAPQIEPSVWSTGAVKAFAAARLYPSRGASLQLGDAYRAYKLWCEREHHIALAPDQFADDFARILKGIGAPVHFTEQCAEILDVTIDDAGQITL